MATPQRRKKADAAGRYLLDTHAEISEVLVDEVIDASVSTTAMNAAHKG
jgi:hypothetical protein